MAILSSLSSNRPIVFMILIVFMNGVILTIEEGWRSRGSRRSIGEERIGVIPPHCLRPFAFLARSLPLKVKFSRVMVLARSKTRLDDSLALERYAFLDR